MSIVGTQSVSMGDLMKLGVPALNAMAQGQQSSIAPSYMVLAALKALTDAQKGQMQQMPQGTVKDQVVAQTRPPIQAGIGQMMPTAAAQPVQKFAEGGGVGGWIDSLPEGSGEGLKAIRRYLTNPNRKPLLDALFHSEEEPPVVAAPKATMPTLPPVDIPEVSIQNAQKQVNADPSSVAASISSSARQRGVGGMGQSPLAKYAEMSPTPSAASFQLDIPKNKQLADAAAKFAKPDDKRLAELAAAESRAGLGAFARGMMNTDRGRGFGAVFGSAAADANDAREKRADARREYEDKREMLATELGLKVGQEEKQDFLAKSAWGRDGAKQAFEEGAKKTELANQATRYGNQDVLEREKIEMLAEANRISAAARRDGLTAAHHDRIQKLYLTAQEIAIKAAESKYGKTDPILAQTPQGLQREAAKQAMYEAEYNKAVAALEARLGGEGNSKAAGSATVQIRKAY